MKTTTQTHNWELCSKPPILSAPVWVAPEGQGAKAMPMIWIRGSRVWLDEYGRHLAVLDSWRWASRTRPPTPDS